MLLAIITQPVVLGMDASRATLQYSERLVGGSGSGSGCSGDSGKHWKTPGTRVAQLPCGQVTSPGESTAQASALSTCTWVDNTVGQQLLHEDCSQAG